MAYKHNIFISYRRLDPSREWVQKWFYERFTFHFEKHIPDDNTVFLDKSSIEAGDNWEATVKNALFHSKIMIAIWTPKYFNEESYCLRELAYMHYRQQKFGNIYNLKGLIIPICLSGAFEDYMTTQYQCIDYTNLCKDPRVRKLPIKLENAIEHLADLVFRRLKYVPEWQDDFILESSYFEAFKHISNVKSFYKKPEFNCPKL